jgi:hypothetical protein
MLFFAAKGIPRHKFRYEAACLPSSSVVKSTARLRYMTRDAVLSLDSRPWLGRNDRVELARKKLT